MTSEGLFEVNIYAIPRMRFAMAHSANPIAVGRIDDAAAVLLPKIRAVVCRVVRHGEWDIVKIISGITFTAERFAWVRYSVRFLHPAAEKAVGSISSFAGSAAISEMMRVPSSPIIFPTGERRSAVIRSSDASPTVMLFARYKIIPHGAAAFAALFVISAMFFSSFFVKISVN